MRIRDIDRAINAVGKAIEKVEEIDKKYPRRYVYELNKIGGIVIDKWYDTYSPIFYHRKKSLYSAFKVSLHGTDYSVEFDSTFMDKFQHRVSNDYIFNLSFIRGYHGGANGSEEKGHPDPSTETYFGTPYWRIPFPHYNNWGRPALKSWSPYNRMRQLMSDKIEEIDKEKNEELDIVMGKVRDSMYNFYHYGI